MAASVRVMVRGRYPAPVDDAGLAARMQNGDREALGECYDQLAPQAYAIAIRILGDQYAAEDVVHDAFVAVWQKMDRFDPSRGSLRAWLFAVVRNRAIDRVRGRRPTVPVEDADAKSLLRTTANPTWDEALARLSRVEVRGVLATLPDAQREAVELAYFDGRTYREIAQLTGVPEGTASGRLRLGLAKMRTGLQGAMERER
jgi:RNA polymerase sigma-70 factor (ECF subfamily)